MHITISVVMHVYSFIDSLLEHHKLRNSLTERIYMKRFAALSLAMILLAMSAVSCSESTENSDAGTSAEETVTSAAETESETEEAEPTVTDIVKEKYGSYDYEGYGYKVMAPAVGSHMYAEVGSDVNEVWVEETDGTPMNDAIYNRNLATEDLINITITPIFINGDDTIQNQVKADVTAGSTEYDAVLNRMDFIGPQAQNGMYFNLKNYIDTSNSWWDKNIVNTFTLFNSKLYWISGDINTFDDFAVEVIFTNKTILEQNGFELPYQDVLEGKWTIEKMYQLCTACERDLDGDGELKVGKDVIGHVEGNDHVKHWIYAMGEKSIDIDDDGNLVINTLTESQINAVDTLYNYMVEKQMTYTGTWQDFYKGNIVFAGAMLGPINSLRDMENDFGVLPMPKKNEEQESYGNYVSNGWTTVYAIPMTNPDPERTGIILEVLCGFSTDTLRSALYDVLFAAKLVRDNDSVEMLNIIFDSKSYDWAVDFSWGGTFGSAYNSVYNNKNNNYVSTATKALKAETKSLDRVITAFTELEY